MGDQQSEETLVGLIHEICSEPLHTDHSTIEMAIQNLKSANIMAALGEDQEFQDLLLRKLREKGL